MGLPIPDNLGESKQHLHAIHGLALETGAPEDELAEIYSFKTKRPGCVRLTPAEKSPERLVSFDEKKRIPNGAIDEGTPCPGWTFGGASLGFFFRPEMHPGTGYLSSLKLHGVGEEKNETRSRRRRRKRHFRSS